MFLKFHNPEGYPLWIDLNRVTGFGIAEDDKEREILILFTDVEDFGIDITDVEEEYRDKVAEHLCLVVSLVKEDKSKLIIEFEDILKNAKEDSK